MAHLSWKPLLEEHDSLQAYIGAKLKRETLKGRARLFGVKCATLT
jgi:hypothetical protein